VKTKSKAPKVDRARPTTSKIVKTRSPSRTKKQAKTAEPKFERTTFRTKREMDFLTERELVTQTGHARPEWLLVITKELLDNGLDACDEADIPPNFP
jgi:DNA topoisomerase VI subunit B